MFDRLPTPVRPGARRRGARPPQDQVGHPRVREDRRQGRLPLLRQRRRSASDIAHAELKRALPRGRSTRRRPDRPPAWASPARTCPAAGPPPSSSPGTTATPTTATCEFDLSLRARGGDRQRQRRDGRGADARAAARGAGGHRHRRPRDRGAGRERHRGGRDPRPARAGPGGVHQPRAARARRADRRRRDRRPADVELDAPQRAARSRARASSPPRRNVEILRGVRRSASPRASRKRVVLRFLRSPVAIHGRRQGRGDRARAQRARARRRRPAARAGRPTSTRRSTSGLVFRSIGYRGVPIEGVPFDEWKRHDPQRRRAGDRPRTSSTRSPASTWSAGSSAGRRA